MNPDARRIVVLGGGFGGVYAALGLEKHFLRDEDPDVQTTQLTFVIAGGGFAGTETVAELRDFAHTARAYYPNIHPDEVKVVLVHHGTRIMPEISADLAEYALRRLRQKGVDVRLQTGVRSATADCVELTTNEKIRARTLVWSAGTSPSPLLVGLPCLRNKRGQVIVNEFLEVPGHPGVWALGDCAEVPNPQSGRPHPPTAQHAVRQGKIVARNIRASLSGGKKMAFAFAPVGVLASLGRRSAVAEICGFKFSGFFAWWLWRTIYLFKLPGLERKVRVAGDWTLDLFFPRDIVLLKLFTSSAAQETAPDVPEAPVAVVGPASR